MATHAEIADTLEELQKEMARRLDELEGDGEITTSASECLFGIIEWAASIEDAMRNCNDEPSLTRTQWIKNRTLS
jgi:hypothetical protein